MSRADEVNKWDVDDRDQQEVSRAHGYVVSESFPGVLTSDPSMWKPAGRAESGKGALYDTDRGVAFLNVERTVLCRRGLEPAQRASCAYATKLQSS